MFDDPKKEVKRLEEQLLKVEMEDDDFESFYSDIVREFGPRDAQEDLVKDVPVRNYSNNYGKQPGQAAPVNRNTYSDVNRAVAPKKKEKGIRGLVITLCVECVGIVAIVLWWVMRIL